MWDFYPYVVALNPMVCGYPIDVDFTGPIFFGGGLE